MPFSTAIPTQPPQAVAPASRYRRLPESVRALAAASPNAVLLETARFDAANHHSYLFRDPVEVLAAHTPDDLPPLFARIEQALAAGRYVAGYASYECGSHFAPHGHGAESRTSADGLPLAWFGVYAVPAVYDHASGAFLGQEPRGLEAPAPPPAPIAATGPLRLEIDEPDYIAAIERIRQYIAAGDTYQVNFTDAVRLRLEHGPAETFAQLLESQPVSYAALLTVQGRHILSLSPELFFSVEAACESVEAARAPHAPRRIVTRPMKGTMPRGLDLAGDAAQAALLQSDEKNRSEHVMIVDLLRNDLGRVCAMGSVAVEDLFTVERYNTLLQMTSTVSGRLRAGLDWYTIFSALFPSGSITGAPKLRTMQIIHELERSPRGLYTGSIGFFAPDGSASFNVAIRTLVVQPDGAARMGVGGGIVADSVARDEYRECQLKASFLSSNPQPFELIETMRALQGSVDLLPLHLDRLEASAVYLGFACDRAATEAAIAAFLLRNPDARLRLLLDHDGCLTLTASELPAGSTEATVRLSAHTVDSGDPWLRHKTTRRALYDEELAAARAAGCDEVLFLNQRGELTEGAISTVFIERDGTLLTPPLASGLLPGVLRRRLLDSGQAREQLLSLEDLRAAPAVYIGNALRGLRRATLVV